MNIQGAEGMSPENIRDEVNRGGRLVIYMYCVSILVMTFKRPTEIRLVKAGHNPAAAGWPYVVVSLLFGWWGFPWGPIYTIECLYRNLCGGIDVTADVLRQLPSATPAARVSPAAQSPSLTEPVAPAKGFDVRTAGLMLGAVCLIVALGLSVYCFQQKQNLTVVLASGLAQPYAITLNGQRYNLKPHSAEVLAMPEGDFVLADIPGGKVVGGEKKFTFATPFFSHLGTAHVGVINPDRTAILANAEVPYYKDGTAPPKDEAPVFTLLANQPAYFIPKPDYVIEKAESRVNMPAGTTRLVKTRLEFIPTPDLNSIVQMLATKSGYAAAREHLMIQAAQRADEELLITAFRTLKPEDVRPFYQVRLAERPVRVEWHRYYQQEMLRHHPAHDLAAEYRAYVQAEPGNGALLYLLGRQTADLAEQNKLWQAALAANPPCAYAHGAIGFDALSEGRFAEALEHYEAAAKSGQSGHSLRYHRHLAYLALGRSGEFLPELAAERKEDPFDVTLADEEIRATYASARDRAAALKLKDAYLAAYKTAKPSTKNLADAEAYLSASIAYLTGDLPAYAKLVAGFEPPMYKFRAALSTGQLEGAAKALATSPRVDADSALLLYLLARKSGDTATAEKHFQAAVDAMKAEDHESKHLAALMVADHPDVQAICGTHINIDTKRILLTALGVRLPGDQATYFGLARKLNFNPEFPHQFLRSILKE